MDIEADLHIHTTASDGELGPEEVLQLAAATNLKAVAITDHDSVEAVKASAAAGARRHVLVVPGVEISCDYMDEEVHLLGYYINPADKGLTSVLERLRESRYCRMRKMVEEAVSSGIEIGEAEKQSLLKNPAPGRLHLAKLLVKKGFATSIKEAFFKYLDKGKPFYVERFKLTPAEIIQMIMNAGGVPVLAHPGLLKDKKIIDATIAAGVKGIEVYYPLHSPGLIKDLLDLAALNKLIPTGGSDFHGPNIRQDKIGSAGVSLGVLKDLLKIRR
ncbi:MAG TPA: PHP domain-containing protein [Firmicutes bacterium]|nr:PHP domain-containing protein [Bacillota bacterium]